MKGFLTWLKAKARDWSAPGSDEALKAEQRKVCDLLNTLRAQERLNKKLSQRADLLRRPFPTVDGPVPDWTQPEVEAWRRFLQGDAGRRLRAIANFHEQACNRSAIRRTDSDENVFANNAGYARGWHDSTDYFFNTLAVDVPPKEDEATESAPGAADIRERLAP